MKNGISRFEYYLSKIELMFAQAGAEKNRGFWLYSNDLRTPLFMLEGLSRLYAGMHNKKKFTKLLADFKLLEDALGAIDYYDAYAKEFLKNESIPADITAYVQAQAREKLQRLNDLLEQRSWIGEGASRLKKIRKKLKKADWKNDVDEIKLLEKFYEEEIESINSFEQKNGHPFSEMESQVHELRRRLRWLSIYPKALQGAIQLTEKKSGNSTLSTYLTEDVINSPYNKMPEPGINKYFLVLEKEYFLALSWMIATLGDIKDEGLRIFAITEALEQSRGMNKQQALETCYQVVGTHQPSLHELLMQSSGICDRYFKDGNLNKLLAGISA